MRYSKRRLDEIMHQALTDSVLDLDCAECGCTIRCEPDATEAYCEDCGRVVKVDNPLIELGMI